MILIREISMNDSEGYKSWYLNLNKVDVA